MITNSFKLPPARDDSWTYIPAAGPAPPYLTCTTSPGVDGTGTAVRAGWVYTNTTVNTGAHARLTNNMKIGERLKQQRPTRLQTGPSPPAQPQNDQLANRANQGDASHRVVRPTAQTEKMPEARSSTTQPDRRGGSNNQPVINTSPRAHNEADQVCEGDLSQAQAGPLSSSRGDQGRPPDNMDTQCQPCLTAHQHPRPSRLSDDDNLPEVTTR